MSNQNKPDEEVAVNILIGAALIGAKDGLTESLISKAETASKLAKNLTTPGDQYQIPHPWENIKCRAQWIVRFATTPGDMNIEHSPHPIDTVKQTHAALVNTAAVTLIEKGLVEGTRIISATAAATVVDYADPFKKLHAASMKFDLASATKHFPSKPAIGWDDYAHLLGNGTHPPKRKSLRDFSGLMEFTYPQLFAMDSHLTYMPRSDHKIYVHLTHQWGDERKPRIIHTELDYLVKVNPEYRAELGSGSEMYHSALLLIQKHYGIKIDSINDTWHKDGELSTNFDAYINARAHGATVNEAVNRTYSGRWASDAGFTEVGGWKFELENINNIPQNSLHPQFKRPVFSDNSSYNNYGNAWASSQGQASQNLTSRHKSAEITTKLSNPHLPLSDFSLEQAEKLRNYIYEHIKSSCCTNISNKAIDHEVK